MARTLFIAETNESGHIDWVWRKGPQDAIPRPVISGQDYRPELPQAHTHGAPAEAILEWLARHLG